MTSGGISMQQEIEWAAAKGEKRRQSAQNQKRLLWNSLILSPCTRDFKSYRAAGVL
jgi:hypothetical protein